MPKLDVPHVSPPQGVDSFLKNFGGNPRDACLSMGFHVSVRDVAQWKRRNEMPEFIFHGLRSMIISQDETVIEQGATIEIYADGKPVGKLSLAKNMTAVIRRVK